MICALAGMMTLANSSMTPGVSKSAQEIRQQMEKEQSRLQESCAWGGTSQDLQTSIIQIERECGQPGWDGYDALPVSNESVRLGIRISKSLPWGFYEPTVGIEPDGQITFEWYKSPKKTCSVSVAPDGTLFYAALNGAATAYGSEPFNGSLPPAILNVINSVYS
jgi:hypothetical protein